MEHATQVRLLTELGDAHQKQRGKLASAITYVPTTNYTDPDRTAEEIRSVFGNAPLVAGHASQLAEPGSFMLGVWDRLPYVVVRDANGELQAFLNVCRHRGARLVSPTDQPPLKAFTCPFHAWTYTLQGELAGLPRAHAFPELERCKYALHSLPVVEHAGLVWLGMSPETVLNPKVDLGFIANDLESFEIDKHSLYRKHVGRKKANWKLLIETYLEGYHVPVLHRKTIAKLFRGVVVTHENHGPHIRVVASRTNTGKLQAVAPEAWAIRDYASVYYVIFPNTLVIMHPDYVSINSFFPESADSTIWTHEMLVREGDFQDAEAALAERFRFTNDDVFGNEDFMVAEQVQAGFASNANETLTVGLEEGMITQFQESVAAAIASST